MNEPNCLVRLRSADRNLAAQAPVIVASGKRLVMDSLSEVPQGSDEGVLECRFVDPNIIDDQALGAQCLRRRRACASSGSASQHVQTVAEPLHVENLLVGARDRGKHAFGQAQVRSVDFHSLGVQAGPKLRRGSRLPDFTLMHQRHSIASLRFVQIGSGQDNRQAFGGQVRQRIPEFAAGHGIDARGGLVEQQHARLRNQRAGQR